MSRARPLLIYSAAVIVVFAIALGLGYAYAHEPERDLIEVVIDRSALPAGDGELASGTVVDVNGDKVLVGSALGTIEVPLSGVTVEELLPLDDPTGIPEGTDVNLGGERTPTERVISGVVLIVPDTTP